jgi:molecular chaperone GrpE
MAKEGKTTKEEVQEEVQKEENKIDENLNEAQKDKNVISLEEKAQASEDKFLRIFSEFENFRRRTQKERSELITGAAADVYKVLLPILDDLDRAKDNIDNAENIKSLKEGLDLIFEKLSKSLKLNGLEQMDVEEQDFNADEHEAITNIPAPTEELKGKVLDVVEKGYTLNGKIIRFPKVVVGA